MECKQWRCKEQTYDGTFLNDSLHGYGTYKWKNSNVYEGYFYSNSKEGYAQLSLPDSSNFEGLFIKDQPFGPGILTYPNGRQDVGFWLGQKLVRLSRSVDYLIPRLAPTVSGKIKLLQFRRLISLDEEADNWTKNILENTGCGTLHLRSPFSKVVYDGRSYFFDRQFFDSHRTLACTDVWIMKKAEHDAENEIKNLDLDDPNTKRLNPLFVRHICNADMLLTGYDDENDEENDEDDICLDSDDIRGSEIGILTYYTKFGFADGLDEDVYVEEFSDFGNDPESTVVKVKGVLEENKSPPKLISWNRGDLCTEIVRQIYRHRAFEDQLNFKITELMSGARKAFRKTGEKERQSLYFLKMSYLGPPHVIIDLLCLAQISENLMDNRGNNALMFAAAGDQPQIIDILSDYGIDINAFNDENLTPLNLCLLRRLAVSNDIYNWEVAFLPPEQIDKVGEEYLEAENIKTGESIHSLDRIFGDGMSVGDEKATQSTGFEESFITPQPSKKERRSTGQKSSDSSEMSQITILNFKSLTEPDETFKEMSLDDESLLAGGNDPTLNLRHKKRPKSYKREEYLRSISSSNKGKYLFDLHLKAVTKEDKTKRIWRVKPDEINPKILAKLEKIDETIDKLLLRGADPNVSDVPLPSIHLGVFTKNPHTVEGLLRFGADPNKRLSYNAGYLTPLHVLALLEPRPEYCEIFHILLEYDADPEMETAPDFSITEGENGYLVRTQGRTPLHLLCTRPDIEYGDPFGYLVSLAIALANASNKKHLYNGYNGLTLAMLNGNIRLVEAFLNAKLYNPNEVVGERGTPLHVLVSTELQKKTIFENSIKMADLLLDAGADPLLTIEVMGHCIDYGYGEVETEKTWRKANLKVKSGSGVRDHLKDHVRVIEYLFKKQQARRGLLGATDDASSVIKSEKGKTVQSDGKIDMDSAFTSTQSGSEKPKLSTKNDSNKAKRKREDKQKGDDKQKGKDKKSKMGKTMAGGDKKGGSSKAMADQGQNAAQQQREKAELFRQSLLKALLALFGNCANFDLKQFMLPYVVLRDGSFYYKFQDSKPGKKEQYSLV